MRKDPFQESDDAFCIGQYIDFSSELTLSIGHFGKVEFFPKVYWVPQNHEIYNQIEKWKTYTVKEANGLKVTFYNEKLDELFKSLTDYKREPFIHIWNLTEEEDVYSTVIEFCRNKFYGVPFGKDNFKMMIEDFFPDDKYQDIKVRIKKDFLDGYK